MSADSRKLSLPVKPFPYWRYASTFAFVCAGFFGIVHMGNIAVACSIAGFAWDLIDIWAERDYRKLRRQQEAMGALVAHAWDAEPKQR